MKKLILVLGLIAFFTCSAQVALACTCVKSTEVKGNFNYKRWLKEFDGAMFTGRVVKVEKVELEMDAGFFGDFFKVTFQVDRFWKGIKTDEATIYTGAGCCDCGVRYSEGEKYFIIADNIGGNLRTNICTSPEAYSDVEGYIKALGDGRKPKVKKRKSISASKA